MAASQLKLIPAKKAWLSPLVNLDGRDHLLFLKTSEIPLGISKPKKDIADQRVHEVDQGKLSALFCGRYGVNRTIVNLSRQVFHTMKLLGVKSVSELNPSHVRTINRFIQ